MDCQDCSNWKCEVLTYNELVNRWENSIGGTITPGNLRRYIKVAEKQGVELENVKIGYKYCSKGVITRFYLMRNEKDHKEMQQIAECSLFSGANNGMEATSQLLRICAVEAHGISVASGITFAPGLYENNMYTRVPLYGSVRPTVERGGAEECSVCGNRAKRSLSVRLEKSFCCNKHYLEWWAKRYREEYGRLNK